MQKLLKYIILFGIFTLPLINSRITELLGFSFSMPVDGNYEFTKVMFFNIWSSLVIFLFFITQILSSFSIKGSTRRGMDYISFPLIFFYIILIISTIFSESPIISLFGNTDKSHSFLMWSNLVGLFIIFRSLFLSPVGGKYSKGDRGLIRFSSIIKTFIISGIFVSIIGLKEYFYPTFNYGDLGNRLFSTFGHPNYLSIFLVSLMPFLYGPLLTSPQWRGIKGLIILLFILTLLLTKSFIAIFLFLSFNLYYFGKKIKYKTILITLIILFGFTLIYNFVPEKLHSFISRYFIWETTIRIIFSDFKIFLFGGGLETLTYFFDNFKSEYIYIFENIGYTADRPHNLILNFFYSFGIGGLIFILGIYYKVFSSKVGNENFHSLQTKTSLILIFIFLLFNPTSIVIYLLIVILLANLFIQNNITMLPLSLVNRKYPKGDRVIKRLFPYFLLLMTIISLFGAYSSLKYCVSEIYSYKNYILNSIEIYKYNPNNYFLIQDFEKGLEISKIKTREYYMYKINYAKNNDEILYISKNFIKDFNFAETYFYIGNIFWENKQEKIAKDYYKIGLGKLPDLWNKNSIYYEKFLVKNLKINDHRLTSEKYGLKKVLDRVGIR